jgi:peptidyl-dipeptidase Dcp
MRRLPIALLIVAACGGSAKQTTTASAPEQPTVEPAPPTSAPAIDPRQRVTQLTAEADQNPLLAAWTGPYGGVPPWDKINSDLFPAAFAKGIELRAAEIDVIATTTEPPTFQNTYAALDNAGRHLDRAETLFSVMTTSLNTKDVQIVDREWSPKLTAAVDAIE